MSFNQIISGILSEEVFFVACKATAEQWRARLSRKKKIAADKWCSVFGNAMQN
jgi:hypothetical protein